MVVMEPMEIIGPGRLTSSTATYTEPNVWNGTVTSYNQGDQVRVDGTVNKIYEAAVDIAANVSNSSPEVDVLSATPKWIEISYRNKYACFDYTRASHTFTTGVTGGRTTLVMVITPGIRFDTLFITETFNVEKITIVGDSPTLGAGVYSYTRDNLSSVVEDHIDIFGIPPVTDIVVTITLQAAAGNTNELSCGTLAIGKSVYIGDIQSTNKLDSVNFSVVERDEFGNATLVPRRSVLKLEINLISESKYIDRTLLVRDSLNAIPAVWYAMENSEIEEYNNALLLLGIYKNFRIQLDNPYTATINLELEEI